MPFQQAEEAARGGLHGSVFVTGHQACDGRFSSKPGRTSCEGFRAMYVVAHRDIVEDAFHAIAVFADEVGGKPDAWFLLDRVHGHRVGGRDWVQCTARFRAKVDGKRGATRQTASC